MLQPMLKRAPGAAEARSRRGRSELRARREHQARYSRDCSAYPALQERALDAAEAPGALRSWLKRAPAAADASTSADVRRVIRDETNTSTCPRDAPTAAASCSCVARSLQLCSTRTATAATFSTTDASLLQMHNGSLARAAATDELWRTSCKR